MLSTIVGSPHRVRKIKRRAMRIAVKQVACGQSRGKPTYRSQQTRHVPVARRKSPLLWRAIKFALH